MQEEISSSGLRNNVYVDAIDEEVAIKASRKKYVFSDYAVSRDAGIALWRYRVARFVLVQQKTDTIYQMTKSISKGRIIYQVTLEYSKRP
jgi:hypothetical protein